MNRFIGCLAYATACALTVLSVFRDVPVMLTVVAVGMVVLGALSAWAEPAAVPCGCKGCIAPKVRRATADDVR